MRNAADRLCLTNSEGAALKRHNLFEIQTWGSSKYNPMEQGLSEILNGFAGAYFSTPLIRLALVPAILCLVGYFIFRNRKELSRHAFQNTAATIVVAGLNIFLLWIFNAQIDAFFQTAYRYISLPQVPADFWASTPVWLLCILGVVSKDFADYWNHRLMHTKWGWPTHAAHHSDTHVNAFTTFRVHILESILMSLSYVVLLTWLRIPEVIPFVAMFTHMHNLYVHMDLPYQHGPFKYLIASPAFHRWHHADVPEAHGKNLANTIPAWDALFGTYYFPGVCKEEMGATKSGVEDKNPFLIYIYPFQQWGRMLRRRYKRWFGGKRETLKRV